MKDEQQTMNRRQFTKAGAVALAAATVATSHTASAQQPQSELETEFLMELLLDGDPQIDTGHTRIAPLSGGTFTGPNIRGTVLPG
ncbi:MAG: DUF3237 domain-containing protein, partial [Gammaproteobacteria bacterium]|nr:DUF3237 domain-containing protein [Gammaproteobacteria bacterium]